MRKTCHRGFEHLRGWFDVFARRAAGAGAQRQLAHQGVGFSACDVSGGEMLDARCWMLDHVL